MATEETTVTTPAPEIPPVIPSANAPLAFNTADLGADVVAPPAADFSGVPTGDAQEYGFDDESVKQYEFELYKGRKGITDRIGFLAFPYGARVHFKQNIGYFQCMSTFASQVVAGAKIETCTRRAACCVHCDAARKRFIAPIIQYSTQPNGQLTPQFGFALKAWLYTDDKYNQMRAIHSEFPLLDHDILVQCAEEQYQRLTISACKAALWKNPKLPDQIRTEIKLWIDTMRPKMAKKAGKKMTEVEFMQKAGLAAPPAIATPGMDTAMVDVAGLLD